MLAAGTGQRLGRDEPKAFVELAGRPMLEWSLLAVDAASSITAAVLVAPPAAFVKARGLARGFPVVAAVVEGGSTRQSSVRAGLIQVPDSASVVVCHDAARPLAGPELFDRVVRALQETGASGVVPVVASADTVKRVRGGVVAETVPRDEVGLAQTPQAFVASALSAAHARSVGRAFEGTDDAMLLEASGHRVAVVEGSRTNFKVTTDEDLVHAEELLTALQGAGRGPGRA